MARNGSVFAISKGSRPEKPSLANAEYIQGKLAALDKVQAIIEFGPDGIVQSANENFLKTMGYTFEEIQGKHHRVFWEILPKRNRKSFAS